VDASSVDGAYDPALIAIIGGTGAGQCRLILQYEGSTKIATVDRTWKVNPNTTSEYVIYADPGREHVNEGLAQGGTLNTITLNASASPFDDEYTGQTVFIRSGQGEDQACKITAYNGTTKVATTCRNWGEIPNSTSAYVILPTGMFDASSLASLTSDSVWSNAIRTLTSGGSGASAKEVWEYGSRSLTSWKDLVLDVWRNIPSWISSRLESASSTNIEMYRGITNTLTFTGNKNISGSSNIIFSVI